MLRHACLFSLIVLASTSSLAQERNWTGWHFGFHGGGAQSNNEAKFSDASKFCHTDTNTTGAGVASATCEVGDNSSETTATSFVPEGVNGSASGVGSAVNRSGSTDANAIANSTGASATAGPTPGFGPSAAAAAAAEDTAAAGGTRSETDSDTQSGGATTSISRSKSFNGSGTAESLSIALLDAFNLSRGGDLNERQIGLGTHIGYLFQYRNGIVVGFEGDLTLLPGQ